MIDQARLDRRAAEICRCGHERGFHDSCSKCFCPWFLPPAEKDKLILAAWSSDQQARAQSEAE